MSAKTKETTAKVRPVLKWDSAQEKSSLQGVAKIWVNKDTLILLTGGVESGKRCWVERTALAAATTTSNDAKANGEHSAEPDVAPVRQQALLASSPDRGINPGVVMMTEVYREACGLHLGDQVSIKPHEDVSVPSAEVVEIEAVEKIEVEKEAASWEGAAWFLFKRAGHVFPGMKFECTVASFKRKFCVKTVNAASDSVAKFDEKTTSVRIQDATGQGSSTRAHAPAKLAVEGIPGFDQESKKLNSFFRGFNTAFLHPGQQRSCAVVVHGGRGTGKSHVLERIAATGWGKVFRIEENDKSSTVEDVFKQAKSQRPSIILIDGLQALIGKDRPNSGTIATKLGQQLDQLAEEAWANNTLPKVAVVASCLDYMTDVPADLQKLTRFERNIPLSIPNAAGRLEILRTMSGPLEPSEKENTLISLSQQTHAYNPSDLCRLMGHALEILAERVDPDQEGLNLSTQDEQGETNNVSLSPSPRSPSASSSLPHVTQADIDQALRSTRPTAMHDVNLKPPTIKWRDVGGQESLKKALQRMIKLTTTTDLNVRRLILTPPKGLLLYGPPGCSKTLSAQAMATESGFNFFAVKGAELLNMYVGESERAVRQLFERARSASPSIIFFDEIDSIGGQRNGGPSGGGGSSKSSGSVNMLTTLLTEMDGFEALTGVLILAATNRPEAMDPALLRPGRFDRVVYVGLPDQQARQSIVEMNLGKLKTAADIDFPELARLAEGFSGAEMKQICSMASNRAVDALLDGERGGDESCITMADVVSAIEDTPRGVTKDMLDGYDRWARRFSKQ